MFEALVITLREGVEAALVLAIAHSLLMRRGLGGLRWALTAGAALALAGSVAVAILALRISWNQELAEGIAMLVGSAIVLSLTWWMWKSAPNIRHDIESGVDRATGGSGGGALGVFLFAFAMVFREGVETAIFLSAAGFNSQGLGLWVGALIGLGLAVLFGVLFIRGTLRIPLKPFFLLTSAVLLLIALQLLVGGLHELSEAQLLPSSRGEMALIGPLVKNELLFFTLTVALAAG
ncbi:MAG: FTR1 family protein, partial [Candidatus Eisenbacteria bacterium]|nr:FTR1 family protein [Candidatus Eisenbacteria bacterium]